MLGQAIVLLSTSMLLLGFMSEAFLHPRGGMPAVSQTRTQASSLTKFSSARSYLSSHSSQFRTRKLASLDEAEIESGPTLSVKKRQLVQHFVDKMGGKRVIQRILIANNGMAATKSILSMRQWAYTVLGDERAIEFVAMATRDDLNANAEFIRLADTFVEVPSGSNKNNYANVDLICKIAEKEKVDAVWPGWGHASENPKLPATLKAMGIQFIGPTSSVMAALGDKVSANILAQTAKVPSIPWSGDGIECPLNEEGVIPEEIFKKACVFTAEEAAQTAEKIGYPVMIKASEGGGGKGIRLAKSSEELRTNFIQVQNEVPGSPIFMMQLCTQARHLEVQIVGDEHGNAIALNGRDCSTQRRFQKIFEEGPPVVAPPEIFREMERSAQRLTQSIGYIGAGTVEYLYNAASNKYYFLELNPRLQVEHPVTEGITGVNLPALQLQVAMGIALDRVPEVRQFFGRAPETSDHIDFLQENYQYPKNHIIAARITAENPDEGFKPTSGKIERVKFQSTNKVWGYFSVGANGGIHEYADSQFGHIFASGPTREDARKSLVLALKDLDVRGDIRTTVEYLIKLLETKEFKDNTIDTSWLDGIIREKSVSVLVEPQVVALSGAIYRTHMHIASQTKEFVDALTKGQTSLQNVKNMLSFPIEITYDNTKYSFRVTSLGPNHYVLKINGQDIEVRIREQPDKSLLCTVGGENYQLFGQEEPLGLRMKINGATVMIPTVYNPSELRSDVTGKIVRYLQQDRDFVAKDQPYVEVEAMKMIMALKATESGSIRHNLSPGSIISAGDLIASLTLQDPSKAKQVTNFDDRIKFVPEMTITTTEQAAEAIDLTLKGFEHDYEEAISLFFGTATLDSALSLITTQLKQYVALEQPFDSQEEASVVSALTKANKDNVATTVPTLIARRQAKKRAENILSILRQLEFLPERFSTYSFTTESFSDELRGAITAISKLKDPLYGPVALKAKQILDVANTPPFQRRLDALKKELLKTNDFESLARQPDIAVSVDLLVVLMSDPDGAVRKAAMETYIRRLYRGYVLTKLEIDDAAAKGVLAARWEFHLRDADPKAPIVRTGYMNMMSPFADVDKLLPEVMARAASNFNTPLPAKVTEPLNVLHLGFSQLGDKKQSDEALAAITQKALLPFKAQFKKQNIRMVNFLLVGNPSDSHNSSGGKRVSYFNHFVETDFTEDPASRDMRPTLPQLLELNRVTKNHDVTRLPAVGRNSFLLLGKERAAAGAAASSKDAQEVLFLRSISHSAESGTAAGAERIVTMALDELERATLDPRVSDAASARLFVNILPEMNLKVGDAVKRFKNLMDSLVATYATRLLELRVDEIEVKLRVLDEKDPTRFVPIRLIASSSTGGWLTREAYIETVDPITGQTVQYCTVGADSAQTCVLDPYPSSNVLQKKRAVARRVGSTYAPDFLGLMEVALINTWQSYLDATRQTGQVPPANLLTFDELVLQGSNLVRMKRFPGSNRVGMLAYHTVLKTPQYPEGREVVIIANDVTVQSGSFGVQEDDFFFKASEYARQRGLPRIFISCNSGARIGLVEELKPKFKIAWKDESNPGLGFEYLYLTEEDFATLPEGTVDAQPITVPGTGEIRYKLEAIIGQGNGIGVENLKGSGLIAGETSRAYDETFTLSYVTGRSVGIGAYLNRLGQRVIQMQQGPMILTGYSALNKLLGKEVYTSQDQLGGPQIMYPNGVTHQVVSNDRDGMQAVVDWLSYTPKTFSDKSPVILPRAELIDPPTRPIDFVPTKTPYDPRHMLAGTTAADGSFVTGFFDKGSFREYLGGWGKGVVTGRARLGGINVGVIAVETRVTEQRIPADPANPESRESIVAQAGQVWYPDSAYKTAQAIEDFNRGENLPLIIFANWRGFSGGTRDMYSEILKYGAMIVDALREYRHPVFVYIPPAGELRGGAWVVIDPSINPNKMEMFADRDARGGILEPPGICEVKYRQQEQVLTMHRLDGQLQDLDEAMMSAISTDEKERLSKDIKQREKALSPLYLQVAHEFADLHDRAGRMKAKGCISEVLEWRQARGFFYWRILRRQWEEKLTAQLIEASQGTWSEETAKAELARIVDTATNAGAAAWNDEAYARWYQSHETTTVAKALKEVQWSLSKQRVSQIFQGLSEAEKKTLLEGI